MNTDETIIMNGMQPKDDELKWNHKKRAKNPFLLFCETVLNHEKELLSETLNSSQESISENLAPIEGQNTSSIENSTFNSDSDGANGDISKNYTNADNEDGDSFNSVTCFCGKPFAGRPMIECSGCLTWLHMSCVKVKRKNIPEFYYCDNCKSNGLLSPSSNAIGSSGEEGTTPVRQINGSNNTISTDGILYSTHQNQNNTNNTTTPIISNSIITSTSPATAATKPKKTKTLKKSSASLMSSSDNIKNNNTTNSDSKYLSKKSSSNVNGKLKKIRQTTKKVRPTSAALTKSNASTLAAAALLTALSVNNQVSPGQILNSTAPPLTNGIASDNSNNLLKSPIATNNNNNIYNGGDVIETTTHSERIIESNGAATMVVVENSAEKFNNKRLKLL